jgi:hypothetical protein
MSNIWVYCLRPNKTRADIIRGKPLVEPSNARLSVSYFVVVDWQLAIVRPFPFPRCLTQFPNNFVQQPTQTTNIPFYRITFIFRLRNLTIQSIWKINYTSFSPSTFKLIHAMLSNKFSLHFVLVLTTKMRRSQADKRFFVHQPTHIEASSLEQ